MENASLIVITVLLAISGYAFTHWHDSKKAQRRANLDRINRQIRDLYGPAYVLLESSYRTFRTFRQTCRPNGNFFDPEDPASESELKAWRNWVSGVFQPVNEQLVDTIFTSSDLLIDETLPDALLQAVSHVHAQRALIARWTEGDFLDHQPPIDMPIDALRRWARAGYIELRQQQRDLLG